MEQLPERHFECSECKKPVAVCYTEIIGKTIYRLVMCNDCPILRQKLYGFQTPLEKEETSAGLGCGNCGMTRDEVKMGSSLGCSICYEVFEDLLIQELISSDRIPQKFSVNKKNPLHVGRMPGQNPEENISMKLLSLHQALNETLSREDYEQAAWLRDQIKALTEGKQDEQGKT
jgi:protein arginine kinase activator